MSIIHTSNEPINEQFQKIPYTSKSELQKIIKSLAHVFTNSSKSLIQTHQIIGKAQPKVGEVSRLATWHNELKESIESFRKRFGRIMGDLRYFLQTGPQEQADLESISSNLKNNDGSTYPGYLLKKELQELCSVVDNSIVTSHNLTNLSFPRSNISESPSIPVKTIPNSNIRNNNVGTYQRTGGIISQSPGRIVVNTSYEKPQLATPRHNNISLDFSNGEVGASNKRISSLTKSGRRRGSIRSKVVVENVTSRNNSVDSNSSKARKYKEEPMGSGLYEGSVTKKPPQAPGRTPLKIGNKIVERVEVIQETPRSGRRGGVNRNSMTKTKIEKELVSSSQLSGSKVKMNYTNFKQSNEKKRRNSLSRSQVSVEKVDNSNSKSNVLEPVINLQPIDPPSQKKNNRRNSSSKKSGSKNRRVRGSNKKRNSYDKENSYFDHSQMDYSEISNRTTHVNTGNQTPIDDPKFKTKIVCGEYVSF